MTVALEEGVELLAGCRVRYPVLVLPDAPLDILDLYGRVDDLLEGGLGPLDLRLLLEIADRGVLGEADRSLVTGLEAHDDAEQRGLAGTVGPDERPALSGVELKRRGRVQDPAAERLRYLVCKCYQTISPELDVISSW